MPLFETYIEKLKEAGQPEKIAIIHAKMLAYLIENNYLGNREDLMNEVVLFKKSYQITTLL